MCVGMCERLPCELKCGCAVGGEPVHTRASGGERVQKSFFLCIPFFRVPKQCPFGLSCMALPLCVHRHDCCCSRRWLCVCVHAPVPVRVLVSMFDAPSPLCTIPPCLGTPARLSFTWTCFHVCVCVCVCFGGRVVVMCLVRVAMPTMVGEACMAYAWSQRWWHRVHGENTWRGSTASPCFSVQPHTRVPSAIAPPYSLAP